MPLSSTRSSENPDGTTTCVSDSQDPRHEYESSFPLTEFYVPSRPGPLTKGSLQAPWSKSHPAEALDDSFILLQRGPTIDRSRTVPLTKQWEMDTILRQLAFSPAGWCLAACGILVPPPGVASGPQPITKSKSVAHQRIPAISILCQGG